MKKLYSCHPRTKLRFTKERHRQTTPASPSHKSRNWPLLPCHRSKPPAPCAYMTARVSLLLPSSPPLCILNTAARENPLKSDYVTPMLRTLQHFSFYWVKTKDIKTSPDPSPSAPRPCLSPLAYSTSATGCLSASQTSQHTAAPLPGMLSLPVIHSSTSAPCSCLSEVLPATLHGPSQHFLMPFAALCFSLTLTTT